MYRKIIYWISLAALIIGTIVPIIVTLTNTILSQKFETIKISNIGFLMLLGLANVSFSWARAVETPDKDKSDRLVRAGEECLCAAVLFLVGSTTRYFAALPSLNRQWPLFKSDLSPIFHGIANVSLFCASYLSIAVLFLVLKLTRQHIP